MVKYIYVATFSSGKVSVCKSITLETVADLMNLDKAMIGGPVWGQIFNTEMEPVEGMMFNHFKGI